MFGFVKRLLRIPDRDSILDTEVSQYDAVVERQQNLWSGLGMDSNDYFGALLNSPPLAAALANLGRVVRQSQLRGSFSDAERELVDMVLSVDFNYWTIGLLHLPDAIAVGVRAEAIEALLQGEDTSLDAKERQLIDYIRMVVEGQVTDDVYLNLQDRLGPRGSLEFTGFVTFLICTFRLWQALGVDDVGKDAFVNLLPAIERGEIDIPEPTERQG
jgi:hypothetical protein